MIKRNLLAAAGLALVAGATFAQGTTQEDARNRNAEARIQQGLADGSLTPAEASRLQAEQRNVRREEARAARHGDSHTMQNRIERMQNHESQNITRDKRNDDGPTSNY